MNQINFFEITLNSLLDTLESGKRPKGGVQGITNGIPSIGGEHLNYDGSFNFINIKYVPIEFARSMIKGNVKLNDILIVKDGATTGKVAYVSGSFPYKHAVVNEHVFICRCLKSIVSKYVFYFLFSSIGQKSILLNFKGTAQGGINTTFVDNVQIPLPPLPEQRAIVSKIEQLFSELDNGTENLKKAKDQLKVYRQAVLKKAFEGELTRECRLVGAGRDLSCKGTGKINDDVARYCETGHPSIYENRFGEHTVGTGRDLSLRDINNPISIHEQIQNERRKEYSKRMDEWKQNIAEWEATGKTGKKPVKPPELKELKPLTEKELKELPELPESWGWGFLKNICSTIFDGPFGTNLMSKDYTYDGIRVIRLENIGPLEFKDNFKTFVSDEKYKTIDNHTVYNGDIIFSSFIGEQIRVCVLPTFIEKAINKADCFCIRVNKKLSNEKYICYFLSTLTAYNQLVEEIHGATRPRINTKQLSFCKIPLCPLPEQNQIVNEIETRFSVCDNMEKNIDEALQKADALRQSILKKAFEGKLLTEEELKAARNEPDWEPAEKLLEKIKKEKEKVQK